VILLCAGALLFFEMKWSRILERRVRRKNRGPQEVREISLLVESAEDFIFTVDADGAFLSMNSFTANFFGGRPRSSSGGMLSALSPSGWRKSSLTW